MPLLRIFSTLPEATFTDEKLAAASKMFSEAIKKPEKWCCVHIVPDQKMIFAGSRDPCVLRTLVGDISYANPNI